MRSKKLIIGATTAALILGAVGAVAAWVGWADLEAWYVVERLARAGEADLDARASRAADLGDRAVPALLSGWKREDAKVAANISAALRSLASRWPSPSDQALDFVGRCATAFPGLSNAGRREAFGHLAFLVERNVADPTSEAMTDALERALAAGAVAADPDSLGQAMTTVGILLKRVNRTVERPGCREVVKASLTHPDPAMRIQAVRLAMRPDLKLLTESAALLGDPEPEVRRAALMAAGTAPEVVAADELLRWLHDPDAEVRRLCEQELRSRGLTDRHVRLGKTLTDPRPAVRLRILEQLDDAGDLDPGVWLRRMSHDPVPAVRAAALRALANQPELKQPHDRLQQMAQNDPSPTVQQLAGHYLRKKAGTNSFLER